MQYVVRVGASEGSLVALQLVEAEIRQHLHLDRGRGLAARHEQQVQPLPPNGCAGDRHLPPHVIDHGTADELGEWVRVGEHKGGQQVTPPVLVPTRRQEA